MTRLAPVLDLAGQNEARILFLTDLHYPENDRAFIQRQFVRTRKITRTREVPYYDLILLGGDITEGNTLRAPGASVTGCSENLALQQFEDDLKLIPSSVPIEIIEGNHDTRAIRETGQDATALSIVARHRGAGMSGNHTIVPIRVATSMFKICMSHGVGGGGTEAGILRFLKNLRDTVDSSCDVYLCGHWHRWVCTEEDDRYTTVRGGRLFSNARSQYFMSGGSTHHYEGSYAEGSTKNRSYKHCSVKGIEILLKGVPESNHDPSKRLIYPSVIH